MEGVAPRIVLGRFQCDVLGGQRRWPPPWHSSLLTMPTSSLGLLSRSTVAFSLVELLICARLSSARVMGPPFRDEKWDP